jgi:transposase-like protein
VRRERKYVSKAERETAIEQWRSGQSVAAVARSLGVHHNTVNYWIRGRKQKESVGEIDLDPRDRKIEELQLQVGALEGTVGRQAMEIRFFRGTLRRVEESRQQKPENGGTASTPRSEA